MPSSSSLEKARRLRRMTMVGLAVLVAGRVLDLWWHSTHSGFERGIEQVQAHWLAWAGALGLGIVATVAVWRRPSRTPGFVVMLVSAWAYGGLAVWHFSLHQQGLDPDLPHVLLTLSQLGLSTGAVLVVAGLVIPSCRRRFLLDRVAAHS